MNSKKCMLCESDSETQFNYDNYMTFVDCPVCGRYQYDEKSGSAFKGYNKNHLASFLFHNAFYSGSIWENEKTEYRYYTTLSKEKCDEYNRKFEDGDKRTGRPVHLDIDILENWYPKSFAEKIDLILIAINSRCKYVGQKMGFSRAQIISLLFVERIDVQKYDEANRTDEEINEQIAYMLKCLEEMAYIEEDTSHLVLGNDVYLKITPKGYARIDELQKYSAHGKNVFVAMRFAEETRLLRENIRKGIHSAGYNAIFIDEVEHNDFITPELLKYLRDSRFVVVDLSDKNNGAYFEEGYAMGIGKPVIQLCKKGVQLHFDIAQKNTIIWEKEEDIAARLENRIRATVD